MFDVQDMLGGMIGDAIDGSAGLGKRRRKKKKKYKKGSGLLGGSSFGTKAAIGVGAFGIAAAALDHFMTKRRQANAPPAAPGPAGPARPVGQTPPAAPPAAPAGGPPPPPPPPSVGPPPTADVPPASPQMTRSEGMTLIAAMIAAAAADGEIDDDERAHVIGRANQSGAEPADRAEIARLLDAPPSMQDVALAATSPELAERIYLVSCLTIDVDTEAEERYLRTLGRSLGLPQEKIDAIHDELGLEL
jgi:uncharacterized membrane protein YebE (DUF533 family)